MPTACRDLPVSHHIWAGIIISLLIALCLLLQAQKAENIMEHEAEIYARPARTWFQTERQKRQAAKGAREAATSAPDIQAAVKGVAACRGGAQGGAAATGKKGKLTKQEQQALRVKKNTFMEVGFSLWCPTVPSGVKFCHRASFQNRGRKTQWLRSLIQGECFSQRSVVAVML